MDEKTIVDHLIEIKEGQASLVAKVINIEKTIGGNGQPGLRQKVDELESRQDKASGALKAFAAIGGGLSLLLGFLEYILHLKR